MFSVPSALLCITFFPPSNSPQVKLNLNFSTTLRPREGGDESQTQHIWDQVFSFDILMPQKVEQIPSTFCGKCPPSRQPGSAVRAVMRAVSQIEQENEQILIARSVVWVFGGYSKNRSSLRQRGLMSRRVMGLIYGRRVYSAIIVSLKSPNSGTVSRTPMEFCQQFVRKLS